ncbi:MAG: efflux RND transporter periplasmic adaptor subunit [Candidatus Limimorpha sp.]
MKKKSKVIICVVLVIVVAAVLCSIILSGKSEELVVRTHVVGEYTIENTVTATGTIEPLEEVEVGTQVSGEISKIFVDFNSVVSKGQILAELDKSNLLENVRQAEASVRSAESELEYVKTSFERTKQLYEAKAATLVSYDEAKNNLVKAETSLLNAKSNLDKAKVNLGYAEIYSPIDGVILSREVEVGQTVAASYSTPTLFKIAKDLTKMKVEADVDEADIGQVKEGQKVTFTVDAYVDDVFAGEVEQIRLAPVTTNNVVTYTVIITAQNNELKLFPGMTASVTIVTEEETGLAIPSEALSFSPDEKILSSMMKNNEMHNRRDGERRGPRPNGGERPQMVWVVENGAMSPRPVATGLGDGVYKIVERGLAAGDSIVLSASFQSKSKENIKVGNNPFMPTPPNHKDNKGGGNGRSSGSPQK